MPNKYTSKLQSRRVLVVGGTSGIGFCVAEAALEHGATVIVASSRQSKIDDTVDRLKQSYPDAKDRISGYPCDLGDPTRSEQNIVSLLEFATKDGKLDHVVSTAGDAYEKPVLANVTAEKFYAGLHVRVSGTLMLAKHCMSYMNLSSTSSFTLTGGVNTHKPGPGWSVAAGVGASTEGMTRGLAVDMKPIRANLVAPGAVVTELWNAIFKTEEDRNKALSLYKSKLLVEDLGQPADVAEAYLYMMKDKFVTGQVLISEGGHLLT